MCKLERNYRANPTLFILDFSPLNVGIKPVQYVTSGGQHQTSHRPPTKTNPQQPTQPCVLCTAKGFESNHFSLNFDCEGAKLSSPDILKLISSSKVCPSCTYLHNPSYHCKQVFFDGTSKICPKGCTHDGLPLHWTACKHSNETLSFTVSKLGSNKSIPLVESIDMGSLSIGIQYDLPSQLSLISKSALQHLPPNMYTVGENLPDQPAPICWKRMNSPRYRGYTEIKQI